MSAHAPSCTFLEIPVDCAVIGFGTSCVRLRKALNGRSSIESPLDSGVDLLSRLCVRTTPARKALQPRGPCGSISVGMITDLPIMYHMLYILEVHWHVPSAYETGHFVDNYAPLQLVLEARIPLLPSTHRYLCQG